MTIRVAAPAWTGLAIRRARADLGLVAVSALVVVVAATVMVATAVHPAASAGRSAIRALEAADPATASVVVTTDVAPAALDGTGGKVRSILADALGPIAGRVVESGRSESYSVNGSTDAARLMVFAYTDDLTGRARLTSGAWPVAATGSADVETVLTKPAADRLGVVVGQRFTVASRLETSRRLTVRVVGLIELNDRADPAWGSDPLVLDGSTAVGPFTTAGPLFVDRATLLGRTLAGRATLTWVAIPTFAGLPAGSLPSLGASTAAIPDRLTAALGHAPAVQVTTGLPGLLADAGAALDRAGSGSNAIVGPLVAIAIYALVLVAALVVDRRRGSTALLRARGAGSWPLLRLAFVESALLAAGAAVVGVPLGILVVLLVGGSEGWGAALLPATVSGWSVAGVAAMTAVIATVALLLPTLGAAGPFASLRRLARSRPGSSAATRSGLDLALLVLAAFLVWQLRSGGASATVAGRGLGPLDMAAPAAALLAGAVLSLRVTAVAARLVGSIGGRARGAVPAIAGRSLARRADAHARVALLLVASVATALLCASLGRSWVVAQVDQTGHATAADVTGQVRTAVGASRAGARSTYLAMPGVTAASAVVTATFDGGSGLRAGHLIAVPANPALAAAALRGDLSDRPLADELATLATSRPSLPLLAVPTGATRVQVTVVADLHVAGSSQGSTAARAASLRVGLVAVAPDGTLTRTDAVPPGDDGTFGVPLPGPTASIVGVEVEVTPTNGSGAVGTVRVASLEASADGQSAASPVDLSAARLGWSFTRTAFGVAAQGLGAVPGSPDTALLPPETPAVGPGATVVAYRPAALTGLAAHPIASLLDPTALAAAQTGIGDALVARFNLADSRRFSIAGTVASFPGVDGAGLAVVDLGTWQLAAYGATGTVPSPTVWWLATDGRDDAAVAGALRTGDYALADVRSLAAETAARRNNPIADAVLGSLGAVGAGALLIAALGAVAASAQGGRARRGEVAVVRAQGLAGRGLAGWLASEEAFPVAVGVAGGLVLGGIVAALVVPALVHALDGVPAVPPVAVVQPVDLAIAMVIGGGLLAAVLAGLRRRATGAVAVAATLRSSGPGVEA